MSRTVAVVTGSRAEYGLLKPVMRLIGSHPYLKLKLYATGMHIEERFGRTVEEIKSDGFSVEREVDIFLQDDTPKGVARSTALSAMGFADLFTSDRPDVLLVLGDRFEIFGAVTAACVLGIPVAHIHGGELTEGVMDEQFRHCITKMSHIHFTVTEEYRNRVVQMGEQPDMVYNTGSPAIDAAKSVELLSREELEQELGVKFGEKNLLVTFHPVVKEELVPLEQFERLLKVLSKNDAFSLFTYANADAGGADINRRIETYVSENQEKAFAVKSLGHRRYLSFLSMCDGMVGNSSSAITEGGFFAKGAVNIGIRQLGRVRGRNIIDCGNTCSEISEAVAMLFSEGFKSSLLKMKSPYGDGSSAEKIVNILETADLKNIQVKRFYDLENK